MGGTISRRCYQPALVDGEEIEDSFLSRSQREKGGEKRRWKKEKIGRIAI